MSRRVSRRVSRRALGRDAAWGVLLLSAVLEAVWASALHASEGFTRPAPTALFVVATVASVVGLGIAMTVLPTGTAYASWTGVGSLLTVAWAAFSGTETLSPLKALLLAGIVACVAGLKRAEGAEGAEGAPAASATTRPDR